MTDKKLRPIAPSDLTEEGAIDLGFYNEMFTTGSSIEGEQEAKLPKDREPGINEPTVKETTIEFAASDDEEKRS